MPYVIRQADGSVSAIFKDTVTESDEFLPLNHPDITAFIGQGDVIDNESSREREGNVRVALQDSDAEIARVTEDLVGLLVKKNIILFTELPDIVQEKLISREKLRSKLNLPGPTIISDDETL
jgi:hypothetical protein